MQNFCGKCGAKLSSELQFCTNCGSKIQTDAESPKQEIKKESVIKEEIKIEKEKEVKIEPISTESYSSTNKAYGPKLKKISFLIIQLFVTLLISNALFNYPLQRSLNLSESNENFIEILNKAEAMAKAENEFDAIANLINPLGPLKTFRMQRTLEDVYISVKETRQFSFPLLDFNSALVISLFMLISLIGSLILYNSISNSNKLKTSLGSFNLIAGLVFTYIVYNLQSNIEASEFPYYWQSYLFYLFLTGSIFLNFIAFYKSKKIISWLLIPAILSGFCLYISQPYYHYGLAYIVRVQLSTALFYLLNYGHMAVAMVLSTITIYLFLKEFIHKTSGEGPDKP